MKDSNSVSGLLVHWFFLPSTSASLGASRQLKRQMIKQVIRLSGLLLVLSVYSSLPPSSCPHHFNQGGKECHRLFHIFGIFKGLKDFPVPLALVLYRNCCCLVAQSCPTFCDPWTVASQAPLSMGFSRQEYWSGLPFHSPVDLLNPGTEPASPALAGRFFTPEPTGKPI